MIHQFIEAGFYPSFWSMIVWPGITKCTVLCSVSSVALKLLGYSLAEVSIAQHA